MNEDHLKDIWDTIIKSTGIPKDFFGDLFDVETSSFHEESKQSKVKEDYVDKLKSIL